jgi:hypothetical protein
MATNRASLPHPCTPEALGLIIAALREDQDAINHILITADETRVREIAAFVAVFAANRYREPGGRDQGIGPEAILQIVALNVAAELASTSPPDSIRPV